MQDAKIVVKPPKVMIPFSTIELEFIPFPTMLSLVKFYYTTLPIEIGTMDLFPAYAHANFRQ